MKFNARSERRGSHNRGQVLVMIAMLATILIGLAGLAVDLVLAYSVKTYLATATDSAAMGGIRALERGVTYSEQEAEIQRVTDMLFNANFPDGLLLTGNTGQLSQQVKVAGKSMDPGATSMFETDSSLAPGLREVRVVSVAEAPTMFMRVFGVPSVTVRAGAYAARRDVNVMVVIDRSASLATAGVWDDVQQAAVTFVQQFDNNRDRLGIVTFGTGGNIDLPLNTGFKTGDAAKNMILSQSVPQSAYTNSGMGLWLAYSELLRVGDPNALNSIVFFTDGQPSAFTAEFDTKLIGGGGPKCGSNKEEGTLGAWQNTSVWNSPTFEDIRGFWRREAGPAPVYYYSGGWSYDHPPNPRCSGMDHWGTNAESVTDPTKFWPKSWQGNEPGSPNKTFCIQPGASGCSGDAGDFSYSRYDPRLFINSSGSSDRQFRGTNVHNAAKNLVLNIAQTARQDSSLGGVNVHVIGLGGYGYDADAGLMKRVANDPTTSYGVTITVAPNEPKGSYTYAPTVGDLQAAFNKVRSEVMRLTR